MRRYNREFRGKDRTTDVLSFPDGEDGHVGDVVISVPQARRQAGERGHGLARELRVLLVHGWLHLIGHDHETDGGTMMRLQRRLVRRLVDRGTAR
jgi:probable rRNA maturation factor